MAEENEPIEQTEEKTAVEEPQGDATDWKSEARKWEDRAKANRKAQEAAEEALAAQSDYESIKAELGALKAEKARAEAVRKAAKEHGVDADLLERMEGDVDENAAFLASRPKYKAVHDSGEGTPPAMTRETIESVKDPVERVRLRAQHQDLYK